MRSLCFSLVVNTLLALLLCIVSFSGGCAKPKEQIIPMEFLVVTEENAADVLAEEPNEVKEEPEPEPEPPKPDPIPEPPPPIPEPPPMPDPIPEVKPKTPEKPKEKAKEKPKEKPKEKAKEKPKDKPKRKPVVIKTGKRVGPVTTGKKDPKKAATQKALSQKEIARLLAAGAKAGNKNQVPTSEASRNYGIIVRTLREACDAYGLEPSPTGRAPVFSITFGTNGAVKSITKTKSSGDLAFDNHVLQAIRSVRRINGLSQSFLNSVSHKIETQVNVD